MESPVGSREPSIGFVILSHGGPALLSRLVGTLDEQYGRPPIAIHHDFSQNPLDGYEASGNAAFVRPHVRTGWGKWSVVEAFLRGLGQLYDAADPGWFFLLSAADYPCMTAAQVREELAATPVDAFIAAHHLSGGASRARLVGEPNPQLAHFVNPINRRLKSRHYLSPEIWVPIPRRMPQGGYRLGRYTMRLPFRRPGLPYDDTHGFFDGDHWFTGNRKVARALLEPSEQDLRVRRHLRFRPFPEEAYYQTVLCNRPELTISVDNRRFTEWNGGGAHPMNMTETEVRRAFASNAFFARKYAPGSPALDLADQLLRSPQRAEEAA